MKLLLKQKNYLKMSKSAIKPKNITKSAKKKKNIKILEVATIELIFVLGKLCFKGRKKIAKSYIILELLTVLQ